MHGSAANLPIVVCRTRRYWNSASILITEDSYTAKVRQQKRPGARLMYFPQRNNHIRKVAFFTPDKFTGASSLRTDSVYICRHGSANSHSTQFSAQLKYASPGKSEQRTLADNFCEALRGGTMNPTKLM